MRILNIDITKVNSWDNIKQSFNLWFIIFYKAMEKSSFKDFFTKDIYWEVEEVLDLDTKLKIFEDES